MKYGHPSTPKSIDKEGNVCYNNKAVERKRTEVTERRETAKEKWILHLKKLLKNF